MKLWQRIKRFFRRSKIYMAIDPAISSRNFTNLIVIEEKKGFFSIVNKVEYKNAKFEDQLLKIKDLCDKYNINTIYIENNAYQKIYAFLLKEEFIKKSIKINIIKTGESKHERKM